MTFTSAVKSAAEIAIAAITAFLFTILALTLRDIAFPVLGLGTLFLGPWSTVAMGIIQTLSAFSDG